MSAAQDVTAINQMMHNAEQAYRIAERRRQCEVYDDNVLDDLEAASIARSSELKRTLLAAGHDLVALREQLA